ncbi:MAG: pyridoxal-phosphate dependent enzyme [Patescibacteria group bacterium]|nr:pyridoxal-phosphate dependent enzyme [Patescibacteria group bacterium]
MKLQIVCLKCGKKFDFDKKNPKCCLDNLYYDNFTPVVKDISVLKKSLKKRWLSLKEGNTPLKKFDNLKKYFPNIEVFGKMENLNPTGSFKDRETVVAINVAKEQKVKEVGVISSGNAAVSAAYYAKKAGLKCKCFVPKKVSKSKLELIKSFGAKVIKKPGFFEDVYRNVIDNEKKIYHFSAGQNSFRDLGSQEISFELYKSFKNNLPDKIIIPIGNGCLFHGIFRGFEILKKDNKIEKIPQLIGVQIKNADPVKKALEKNKSYYQLKKINDSIAEGIVALESYCSPKAILVLKETKGFVVEVTDNEIKKWDKIIQEKELIFLEPTAITVFPALKKIKFKKGEKIVLILTGSKKK